MNPEILKIYSKLPRLHCRGLCADFCKIAPCHPAEAEALLEKHGRIPLPTKDGLRCSELTPDNRCGIYEDRPIICRLWGTFHKTKCPHGCKPVGGFISEAKQKKYQYQVLRIPAKANPVGMLEEHMDKLIEEGIDDLPE